MTKTQNYAGIKDSGGDVLSIFCSDSVEIKARVTFNSCVIDGLRLTYWYEVPEDPQQVIDDMFAILFKEVERVMEENRVKVKSS